MNLTDCGRFQVEIKLQRTRQQGERKGGEGLYGVTFRTQCWLLCGMGRAPGYRMVSCAMWGDWGRDRFLKGR